MAQYYFLTSLLPDLKLGALPELPFHELQPLLKTNLTEADWEKTKVIRRLIDIENLRALWNQQALDIHGNFSKPALEDYIVAANEVPLYLSNFLDRYQSVEERASHYPQLLAQFFQEEIPKASGFLKEYLELERQTRLVLSALRAKREKKSIELELQYEDPQDELAAQILAQKDAPVYEPLEEYSDLKILFERALDDPLQLQLSLIQFHLNQLDKLTADKLFAIDKILAYLIGVTLIERHLALQQAKGQAVIDAILKDEKLK